MELTLEERKRRLEESVRKHGSQRALADAIGISQSRLSKALAQPTDRRLAPIELAAMKKGIFDDKTNDSEELEEKSRTTYLQIIGPGGRVMAQIDLCFMGTSIPIAIPMDLKEGVA